MKKHCISVFTAFILMLCILLTALPFTAASVTINEEQVLFEGSATSVFTSWSEWKSAVSIDNQALPIADFNKAPFTVKVHYTSNDVPIMVMQSWSGGTSWADMIPSFVSEGVAYYRFDTISGHYGTDFSLLNSLKVMPNGSDLTVTKVSFFYEDDSVSVPYKGLAGKIANNINAGWNLGNTLDSHASWIPEMTEGTPADFETAWENPVTTREIIEDIRSAGFNAVRVPVTWKQHTDSQGNIDENWLNRVQEVVDYVIDADMYCILNVHHDTGEAGWIRATPQCVKEQGGRFSNLWTQIAQRFKDYDEKLLFEGFNEILDDNNNWGYAGKDATNAVNELNQLFVDAVRATGGDNAVRCLVVNTYAANTDGGNLDEFSLPDDTAKDSLIVQVHYYHPYKYCTETYTQNRVWTEENGKHNMNGTLYSLYYHFTSKGIPVIIGEFGVSYKNNEPDRCEYAKHLVSTAKGYGIKCFYWDPGGSFKPYDNYGHYAGMSLYNRFTGTWIFPDFTQSITGIDPNNPPETTAPSPTETTTQTETSAPVATTAPVTTTAPFTTETTASIPATETTTPENKGITGDADQSGDVNIKDATLIQKTTANLVTLTAEQRLLAEVTGDESVNIKDATAIQKYIAGIITEFDI